jgi:hypothetical protein
MRLHPFFVLLYKHCRQGIDSIIHLGMSELYFPEETNVFMPGSDGNLMYFIVSGRCEYTIAGVSTVPMLKGAYLCEAAMWIRWKHRGRLGTQTACEIFALDGDTFEMTWMEGALKWGWPTASVRDYAAGVVNHYINQSPVTDIWGDAVTLARFAAAAFGQ